MKKQKLQFTVMIAVLVLLAAGYFGLKQFNRQQEEQKASESGEALAAVEASDVVRFAYDYNDQTYSYVKENDVWYYEADKTMKLTQYNLTTIASNLAGLTAQETIEDVEDMAVYGLADGYRNLTFETADGESFAFCIGSENELTKVFYLSRPGENKVYTVAKEIISVLSLDPSYIVEEETEAAD